MIVNGEKIVPKIKRGFNQTPLELKEKLYNEKCFQEKKELKDEKLLDLRKAMNNLKKF